MTKQIRVRKLKIGGGAPIVIQSMAKTDTRDVSRTVKEIKRLEKAGCELVRVAVKDFEGASLIKKIRKSINIPLVADIHFDYRLAITAIQNGIDKIRLNPGNIYKEEHIIEVVRLAKKRRTPIRVGVNSGSVFSTKHKARRIKGERLADLMVKSALDYIKILEKQHFYDIIVSLKSSDVLTTIDAYRRFSKRSNYPLHLGITASGPISKGIIKSSIGIGALLLEGIGDTVRVSLTGDPCQEVAAAKDILQSLGLRRFGPEVISCPTCGRSQVDLQKIVADVEKSIADRNSSAKKKSFPKIAIMGCEVNGPGEAKEADIGIACGKKSGVIFKKGKLIKRVKEKDIVKELIGESRITLHG